MSQVTSPLLTDATGQKIVEQLNAIANTIEPPDVYYIYDKTTGQKYALGIDNGLMFYEEEEE